ncbi:arylsulfatase [Rubritalea tangerina]|uniref:Arylsulfatase n=1 Tax=Rubritalea tangerina TaxID=430798 RepID=A0ABW4ZDN4_9BACT
MFEVTKLVSTLLFAALSSNAYTQSSPSKPNIMLIVVDDMGYSDLGSYGGEIRTPNIDKLASNGIRFTRFYTQPMCAPTRASILTGVDNHQNGLGAMAPLHTKNQYMQPGYEGFLNDKVATLAEVLVSNGYHTYMSGKWHLGSLNSSQYPYGRGFEKSFAQMAGGSGYFEDGDPLGPYDEPVTFYVKNDKKVDQLPKDFYSTKDFTDHMIQFIKDSSDEKPFFGYLAYTAPHDPLHITDDYINKYKGEYDIGYDSIRKSRLERMKDLDLIDQSVPYNAGTGNFPKWKSLTDDQKTIQARKMEIYASMIEYLDDQLGHLIQVIKDMNRFENTLFIFMSDNGPNPYESAFYYLGDVDAFNKKGYDNSLKNLGRKNSFTSLGGSWAEVTATPYSYYKTTTGEGGIRAPLIISGSGVVVDGITDTTVHAADIYPTILEYANVERPETFKGKKLNPLFGQSAKPFLEAKTNNIRNTEITPLCFESGGHKAVYQGYWKLMQGSTINENGNWVLINLKTDPTEKVDLSAEHPARVKRMTTHWEDYSKAYGYIAPEGKMYVLDIGAEEFYKYEQK